MSKAMYRAHIIEYPDTETRMVYRDRDFDYGDGWTTERSEYETQVPEAWEPSEGYIERFRTNDWIQPDTNRWFKSRSSAAERVDLLNAVGYTAIVQRSAPVQWPEDGETKVNDSETVQVAEAIRVLKRTGLIKSADELFGGK